MTILQNLEVAQRYLNAAVDDLKITPDKAAISELMNVCCEVDEKYKDLCAEYDDDDKLEPGTTYNGESPHGSPSIEFYIESTDWEKISRALRKLGVAKWDREQSEN